MSDPQKPDVPQRDDPRWPPPCWEDEEWVLLDVGFNGLVKYKTLKYIPWNDLWDQLPHWGRPNDSDLIRHFREEVTKAPPPEWT